MIEIETERSLVEMRQNLRFFRYFELQNFVAKKFSVISFLMTSHNEISKASASEASWHTMLLYQQFTLDVAYMVRGVVTLLGRLV